MKHIDTEATIRIVQINSHRWQLETLHGYVLQDYLFLDSVRDAEAYVKNYLSSFNCWKYEVVPLEKSKK